MSPLAPVCGTDTCRGRLRDGGGAVTVKVLVCVGSAGSTNVSVWDVVEETIVVVVPDPVVSVRSTVVVRVTVGTSPAWSSSASLSSASAEVLEMA